MRTRSRAKTRWAVMALGLFAAACENENTLESSGVVTVSLLQDVFTFEVTDLDHVTDHTRYLMAMTGDQAMVDVTSDLTDGSAFLQIRGGDGEVVYAEDIESEVDGVTDANIPGLWQIDIVFDEASGGFAIDLERDTVP